jgi:hypothetical protein
MNAELSPGEILRQSFAPSVEEQEEVEVVATETDDALIESEQHEESEQVEETGGEESDIQTITQLAEELEIDPSEFYNLQVPLADGMEPISLGEIKDKYQEYLSTKDKLTADQAAIEAERTALATEAQQAKSNAISEGANTSKEIVEAQGLLQAIQAQYESIDWTAAEKENPGEAVLYKQKLNEAYGGAQMKLQQASQANDVQKQQGMVQYYTQQWAESLKARPEWAEESAYRKDRTAIEAVAVEYGFAPQEASQIADARTLNILHDYAQMKAKVKSANANAKEVVRKPTGLKPSGLRTLKGRKQTALKRITDRAKATGDRTDQRAAVSAILNSQR